MAPRDLRLDDNAAPAAALADDDVVSLLGRARHAMR